jgi:hypothetical protein
MGWQRLSEQVVAEARCKIASPHDWPFASRGRSVAPRGTGRLSRRYSRASRLFRRRPARSPASAEDWPPVLETGEIAWQSALERLRSSHEALAADVRHLASEAIDAKVAGLDYSVSTLLHGVIEHGAYHGGQIRLLAKAAGAGSGR